MGRGRARNVSPYMHIVAAGVRLPEIILIFAGPGGEGKTLLLCDLMRDVWGSDRAVAPPSILQTTEEFRKQGHLYMGMRWVSVDESKNTLGIEDDVFKIFVSGGALFLWKTTRRRPTAPTGHTAGNPGR